MIDVVNNGISSPSQIKEAHLLPRFLLTLVYIAVVHGGAKFGSSKTHLFAAVKPIGYLRPFTYVMFHYRSTNSHEENGWFMKLSGMGRIGVP